MDIENAVIDKATPEAMIHGSLWDPLDDVRENVGKYVDEVDFRFIFFVHIFGTAQHGLTYDTCDGLRTVYALSVGKTWTNNGGRICSIQLEAEQISSLKGLNKWRTERWKFEGRSRVMHTYLVETKQCSSIDYHYK